MAEDNNTSTSNDKPTARMIAEQKAADAKKGRGKRKSFKDNLLGGKISALTEQLEGYRSLDEQGLMGLAPSTREIVERVKNDRYNPYAQGPDTYGMGPEFIEKRRKVALSDAERLAIGKSKNIERIAALQRQIENPESLVTDPIEKDMLRGSKFGEAILGEEGLGRLSEDVDVQEALQRYKDISEKGLSREEVEAEKGQMFKEIQSSTETARRQLQAQLAKMGVRGGIAGSQVRDVITKGMSQQADVSRDLFLKSEGIKRQGLADYSSRLGEMKTFDLAQEAAEKNIVLQAGLGIAQTGSAERAAKYAAEQQRLAAQARSQAASCFLKQTEIELKDGSKKTINNLALGDELKTGKVTGVMAFTRNEEIYDVEGIYVSGSHYVFDADGVWKTVRELGFPVVITSDEVVYTLTTTSGTLEINGILFSDHEGFMNSGNTDEFILREMNEFTKDVLSREVRSESN